MNTHDLLSQFAPFCYFHQKETSFPITYDAFIANSDLCIVSGKQSIVLPDEYKERLNEMNPRQIIEHWLADNVEQRTTFANGTLSFQPHTTAEGMAGHYDSETDELTALPVHTQVSIVTLRNTNNELETYYRLTYLFLYRDNIPSYAFGAGKHDSDIEHVAVYVKRNDDGSPDTRISQMYYSSHGVIEGTWLTGDQVKLKDGHPVVYIARGSHADYPRLGTGIKLFSDTRYVWRIFGFANDQISNGIGYQVTTDDLVAMPRPILNDYAMSAGGGVSLGKSYVSGPEPVYSTSRVVRQLPTSVLFWKPEKWVATKNFNEQVIILLDFNENITTNVPEEEPSFAKHSSCELM